MDKQKELDKLRFTFSKKTTTIFYNLLYIKKIKDENPSNKKLELYFLEQLELFRQSFQKDNIKVIRKYHKIMKTSDYELVK